MISGFPRVGRICIGALVGISVSALGNVPGRQNDALGRQVTASSASDGGARSVGQTLVYNALGQVASVTDAAGNVTAFAYDAAGRQSAVTNALGQVTRTAYDAEGRVLATWGATYPVAYEYDGFGRMIAMATTRDPAHESLDLWTLVPAGTTLTAYSLQSTALDLTQWQYDLATGLVTNKVYADGKGTAYTYTADGKLARRTWARGVATDYGYTPAGELETVNYSDATPDVTYAHDRLGRPVTIADVTGTRTNVYDVATLALAQEKLAGGLTLTRSQDVLGRSAGISMPDYSVEYGYDDYGRFGSVTANVNATTNVFAYGYVQGSDMLVGWSSNGGMSFHRTFEPNRDLVASITNAWNGVAVSSFAYTNDEIGRRTARVDSGSTQNSFGYNIRSEVVEAIMGAHTYGYEYDPIGNRLTATNNAAVTTYAANELNQYTNVVSGATVVPAYDDDGNMTAYGPWAFAWDGENRLIGVTSNSVAVVTNAYDFASRRIVKTSRGITKNYQYDGWNLIRETAGTNVTHYVWGLDLSQSLQGAGGVGGLLAVSVAGGGDPGLFFPAYDANGNVTDYVNSGGSVVARYEYDPFGGLSYRTGTLAEQFAYRFSTKYWDAETALYYYGYRYYSPELGRWVSKDPLGEVGSLNTLLCCQNNSINTVDILGLKVIAIEIGNYDNTVAGAHFSIRDYVRQLQNVRRVVSGITDASFAKSRATWNGVIFKGSRREFIDLLDYEIDSQWINGSWNENTQQNRDEVIRLLEGSFSKSDKGIVRGNIATRPFYFFIIHGEAESQSCLMGVDNSDFLYGTKVRCWRVPFNNMREILRRMSIRSGYPVVFVSCFSSRYNLMEKIVFYPVYIAKPREIEPGCWRFEIETLGGKQSEEGWQSLYRVSAWKDGLSHDLSDATKVVDGITEEKTISP